MASSSVATSLLPVTVPSALRCTPLHPFVLAVDVIDNVLGQRDGCARQCIQFVDVVGLSICTLYWGNWFMIFAR